MLWKSDICSVSILSGGHARYIIIASVLSGSLSIWNTFYIKGLNNIYAHQLLDFSGPNKPSVNMPFFQPPLVSGFCRKSCLLLQQALRTCVSGTLVLELLPVSKTLENNIPAWGNLIKLLLSTWSGPQWTDQTYF